MVSTEVIRVVQAADLLSIPETTADMLLIFDRDTVLANGTLPFPLNPVNWQTYTLSTKSEVTNFTVDTGGRPINGVPSTLPTGVTGWIYLTSEDEWFSLQNPPISNAVQTLLNTKLATNGNGSSLTGLTAAQVNLGNVTNESKATMFTSPTFTGTPVIPTTTIGIPAYFRVTGSNATTTGQALTNVTGLSAPLVANAVYEFEATMSCSVSAVTTGISYGVNYSAAGATIEANIIAASSTTATKTERISAFNSATTAFLATSAQAGGVNIRGVVATGANAGNLTIQHLKITSGTSTVFINSVLKVTRIS